MAARDDVSRRRAQGLERSRILRMRRAELLHALTRGETDLATVLEDPACGSMMLFDLLCRLPSRLGRAPRSGKCDPRNDGLAARLFDALGTKPLIEVRELTDRQRSVLVALHESERR